MVKIAFLSLTEKFENTPLYVFLMFSASVYSTLRDKHLESAVCGLC